SVRTENLSASASFPHPLADGLYRVTLTPGITDHNANPLEAPMSWDFRVGNKSFWAGPFNGSWQDPGNWSTGVVPGTNDDVVVDVFYGVGRVLIEGENAVKSLELFEELELPRGASLEVLGGLTTHRDLIPSGGLIRNTVLKLADGALIKPGSTVGSTLQNVTVNGDIVMDATGWLQFLDGLTLNCTLTLLTNSGVRFGNSLTLNKGV